MLKSHEIPKQLFSRHDEINDYPYALAHLLSEELKTYDKEYAEFYQKQLLHSKFSILDNGAYELGSSINTELLHKLGEDYKPTHVVLPDVYGDKDKTIELVEQYLKKYWGKSTPKFFAVLQGQTLQDYKDCFLTYLENGYIDIIGINYRTIENKTRLELLQTLLDNFEAEEISYIKIHLLGCSDPGEFLHYSKELKQRIHSVDTSSPIINGWLNRKFTKRGFKKEKSKHKLAEHLDMRLDPKQLECVNHNIKMFKEYIK